MQAELGFLHAGCVKSEDPDAARRVFVEYMLFIDSAIFLHNQTTAGKEVKGVASGELTELYAGTAGAAGQLMLWAHRREYHSHHSPLHLCPPRRQSPAHMHVPRVCMHSLYPANLS